MTPSTVSTRPLLKSIVCLAVFVIVVMGLNQPLTAGTEINTGYFGNVAIKGYDPVAYFAESKVNKLEVISRTPPREG